MLCVVASFSSFFVDGIPSTESHRPLSDHEVPNKLRGMRPLRGCTRLSGQMALTSFDIKPRRQTSQKWISRNDPIVTSKIAREKLALGGNRMGFVWLSDRQATVPAMRRKKRQQLIYCSDCVLV